ncbi:MAG: hypothetical protein QXN32_04105, partial [Candidatus Nitrosocaldus sp.]
IPALIASAITALVAYAEIRVSRPYKELKRSSKEDNNNKEKMLLYEKMLKLLSMGSRGVAVSMIILRALV